MNLLTIITLNLVKYTVEIHIIFGPTAASKTKIAQGLWEQYHFPILSVDSRKVYKGADIGTNKLSMVKFIQSHPEILVGGIDFLEPTDAINAYTYQQYVYAWLETHRQKLESAGGLIIHGGTGLYLDAILDGKSFLSPGDMTLRKELEGLTVEQLQERADRENNSAFLILNESDRKNPRRLIRLIENKGIAEERDIRADFFKESKLVWHITLPEREVLYKVINERVLTYFSQGWLEEVNGLLATYGDTAPALSMMGYRQLVKYIQENKNWQQFYEDDMPQFQTVVSEIQQEHRRYAKRQETWAKKYLKTES